MTRDLRNQTDWLTPLLALALWAAHFMILWAASSIFPGQPHARWIALAVTLGALAALIWLWRASKVRSVFSAAGLGIAVAAAAILFDALPALIG
ncbi:hypothetical protein [Allopontixanthobacter sp.]|uniref:hypothetical protein n=1 Tax=Allopontixanthobacter sp. TaxID=2906452 RepID=UPI002ABAC7F4|nr:hypothetical protein [Allopontixanthobacter sp.]MDZ4307120.1 hypothetical protein [Allopontixanthobacter sp.]